MTFLLVASALLPIYGLTKNPYALLGLGPFVAFFGTGYFSGFGVLTAKIYPTSIRATAQGFTCNIGRIASAASPFIVGSLAATRGFGVAFAMTAAAFLLAAVAWIWIPERRGTELIEVARLKSPRDGGIKGACHRANDTVSEYPDAV